MTAIFIHEAIQDCYENFKIYRKEEGDFSPTLFLLVKKIIIDYTRKRLI